MIKKLKIKFIALAMVSLLILLSVLVLAMNLINYTSVVREADEILSLLSHNKGRFPAPGEDGDFKGNKVPPHMSPELPYEIRYFSVLLTQDGNVLLTETSRITAVDSSEASQYAKEVLASDQERGFTDQFRFIRFEENDAVRITFLDCGRQLDSVRSFLLTSAGIALIGFVLVFFVMFFCSGRIIRPIAQSYEKQKRFITDAGHEIKTPLTIIRANADILEMEYGKNEALADIQQQSARLASLTADLVSLARMEESDGSLPMIDFPLSEIVRETVHPFQSLAQTQGKELTCQIQPMLTLHGNSKAIQQLLSILLDNAMKYSPEGGRIAVSLSGTHRAMTLRVYNTTAQPIAKEDLPFVFDRFFRTDPSRSSETGGHGIGLSIAKAIVHSHGGKIQASTKDGMSFCITVTFPA
ncbi:MAG: HAMP domain-containing histidine kinase [Clostridia bacterium]|nr:HAMP domain-containing histidine kinase [Clostridia bacterium]